MSPPPPTGGGGLVRVRLDLAYDGTGFAGWARQPGLRTVAGEVEAALARVLRLGGPPATVVAGRTDAGVHARGQVCHVDVPAGAWAAAPGRSRRAPGPALVTRLAGVLPPDVRVRSATVALPGFDARFSALRRHYAYRVSDDPAGVEPLRVRDVVGVRGGPDHARLDVAAMDAASAALVGLRDFAAYCRPRPGATTTRTLLRFRWRRVPVAGASAGAVPDHGPDHDLAHDPDHDLAHDPDDGLVVAEVVADAFCHSMVRALVGAALAVGQGRRGLDWPAAVLAAGVRDGAVRVAPAHGLVLERVDYPAPEHLAERAHAARARRDEPVRPWQPRSMTTTPDAQRGEPGDHDGILELADSEDDEYASAVLDEGYSPRERSVASAHYGLTAEEEEAGTTLEQRLREEEPDDGATDLDAGEGVEDGSAGPDDGDWPADAAEDGELLDDEVGRVRAGRLVAPDQGIGEDTEKSEVATDVGIDGGAASAEEAAMHVVPEEDDDRA